MVNVMSLIKQIHSVSGNICTHLGPTNLHEEKVSNERTLILPCEAEVMMPLGPFIFFFFLPSSWQL